MVTVGRAVRSASRIRVAIRWSPVGITVAGIEQTTFPPGIGVNGSPGSMRS